MAAKAPFSTTEVPPGQALALPCARPRAVQKGFHLLPNTTASESAAAAAKPCGNGWQERQVRWRWVPTTSHCAMVLRARAAGCQARTPALHCIQPEPPRVFIKPPPIAHGQTRVRMPGHQTRPSPSQTRQHRPGGSEDGLEVAQSACQGGMHQRQLSAYRLHVQDCTPSHVRPLPEKQTRLTLAKLSATE